MRAARAACALAALVAAGCVPRATTGAVATLPLVEPDLAVRARLLAMADARRPDSALIEDALGRERASVVRAAAALAVGQVGARGMAPRLRTLLADGDTAVAASAAFALGLLRDTSSVDALAATYVDGGVVAREAGWALAEIGAPARPAIEALLALLAPRRGPAPDLSRLPLLGAALEVAHDTLRAGEAEKAALLLAAQRLRPVPVALVLPYLPDRDARPVAAVDGERTAWAAAYALARTPAPAAVRAMLVLVASPDVELRAQVASALRRAAAGDSLAREVLPALALLARDPHPHVRINAVRSLASHGESGRDAILRALSDADANVRVAAAQSAARVVRDSAGWMRLWAADTTFMVRRSLLASAAQAGVPFDGHEQWRRAADWRLRLGAAEAPLGAASWSVVRRAALPLLGDPDGRVRNGVAGVLAGWADSASVPEARAALRAMLEDEDFFARASALSALAARATAAEVPLVLRSYARARRDSANDARLAAVAYLAAAWRRDSAAFGDSLRTALATLPVPSDPLEREPALGLSPFRAWPGRAGEARPDAWYRDVLRATLQPALEGRPPVATLATERGTITIELFGIDAPITAHNFMTLARAGYYRDTRFHRVVPNFVAQDGDPRGDGNGGPGYAIRDELNRRRYDRGAVGMALSGPDTGGSQYFLAHAAQPHLDGHYTVFGRVVAGWEALDALVQGDRILSIEVR